jgi:WD repeat-containing protein 7
VGFPVSTEYVTLAAKLTVKLRSLRLLARWTLFATPLMSVIGLTDDSVGRLKEHVLCVANGGTVAVLSLDGLEMSVILCLFLSDFDWFRSFLIPGGPDRLEKIALGEDNLMLIYSNDMARLWDVRTQEFWRSMTREKAEELLEQGGWFETFVLVIYSWLQSD